VKTRNPHKIDDGAKEPPGRSTHCGDCMKLFGGGTAAQNADRCRQHQESGLCPK